MHLNINHMSFFMVRDSSALLAYFIPAWHVSGSLFKCICGREASEHSGIVEQTKTLYLCLILSLSNNKYSLLILLPTVFLGSHRAINPACIFPPHCLKEKVNESITLSVHHYDFLLTLILSHPAFEIPAKKWIHHV